MRLFFAVKMPAALKEQLAEFVGRLSGFPGRVKWVETQNMHLTLKFLGEVSSDRLPELRSAAENAAGEHASCEILVSDCGAFPNMKSPRVFWIGVNDAEKRLQSLQKSLDYNLGQLGFERERKRYSPHLTVGRVKDQGGLGRLKEAFAAAEFPPVEVEVADFFLIESKLTPAGPIYTDLMRFPLQKGK
jgi:2'-5' RNA ligase